MKGDAASMTTTEVPMHLVQSAMTDSDAEKRIGYIMT